MISIKPLPEFTAWLDGLSDVSVRSVVIARIKRLALGLMGDVAPVGEGVSELRIHVGASFTPLPFKGRVGVGWVEMAAKIPHPHPALPLEGEGTHRLSSVHGTQCPLFDGLLSN